jgi:guanylate kinase
MGCFVADSAPRNDDEYISRQRLIRGFMYTRHFTLFANQNSFFQPAKNAHLYVISGPSGVGKTTIINRLLNEITQLEKIVGYTTRQMRPGEIPDQTYHYIDCQTFDAKMQNGDFLEAMKFSGNYYGFGMSSNTVLQKLNAGTDLIVDMDYSQINDLKSKIPNCMAIFIMPPNLEDLKQRLIQRGDLAEVIDKRMHYAQNMIDHASICDEIVVNEDGRLDASVEKIKMLILENRQAKLQNKISDLLDNDGLRSNKI